MKVVGIARIFDRGLISWQLRKINQMIRSHQSVVAEPSGLFNSSILSWISATLTVNNKEWPLNLDYSILQRQTREEK